MKRHFFLTGLPGIGKTTALFRILQPLTAKTAGFHTEEIREAGRRTGLAMIASNGATFRVAACGTEEGSRVGKYLLDPHALENAMRQTFAEIDDSVIIYADPIGALFCRSPYFIERMQSLLRSHTVIGTIARRGHAFVEALHRREDCAILEITPENRDALPAMLLHQIQQMKGPS
jgi:nucleoside-triphosphatase